jgi:hypothetical protein
VVGCQDGPRARLQPELSQGSEKLPGQGRCDPSQNPDGLSSPKTSRPSRCKPVLRVALVRVVGIEVVDEEEEGAIPRADLLQESDRLARHTLGGDVLCALSFALQVGLEATLEPVLGADERVTHHSGGGVAVRAQDLCQGGKTSGESACEPGDAVRRGVQPGEH